MTKQETAKVIAVITTTYPSSYSKFDSFMIDNLITAWHSVLEDYTYEQANAGLKIYLSSDTTGFPPSPGQVIDCIHKIEHQDEMTPLEAWQYVSKAIKNSIYHSEEEFAKLPEIVQRAVGNQSNLKEWAMMDSETVQSVEQSHFIRAYDSMVKRKKEDAKIPAKVRQMIERGELIGIRG